MSEKKEKLISDYKKSDKFKNSLDRVHVFFHEANFDPKSGVDHGRMYIANFDKKEWMALTKKGSMNNFPTATTVEVIEADKPKSKK